MYWGTSRIRGDRSQRKEKRKFGKQGNLKS